MLYPCFTHPHPPFSWLTRHLLASSRWCIPPGAVKLTSPRFCVMKMRLLSCWAGQYPIQITCIYIYIYNKFIYIYMYYWIVIWYQIYLWPILNSLFFFFYMCFSRSVGSEKHQGGRLGSWDSTSPSQHQILIDHSQLNLWVFIPGGPKILFTSWTTKKWELTSEHIDNEKRNWYMTSIEILQHI